MVDILKKITQYGDIALACGIVGILMVLLFSVPTVVLLSVGRQHIFGAIEIR